MAFAPALEPVALAKTSMNGNPVGEFSASCLFPKQNKVATTIAKPSDPLRATEANMLLGITVEAFSISSAYEFSRQSPKFVCSPNRRPH